jgi:hypothetical protein
MNNEEAFIKELKEPMKKYGVCIEERGHYNQNDECCGEDYYFRGPEFSVYLEYL